LADDLTSRLQGDERYLLSLAAERSDFVRFTRAQARQAGTVEQAYAELTLIDGKRHAAIELALSGELDRDRERLTLAIGELRETLRELPDDPHLHYNETPISSEQDTADGLPDAGQALDALLSRGAGYDMVGLYAAGTMTRAFANSLGQRNWFRSSTFNADWSFHLPDGRAIKCNNAGAQWDEQLLAQKISAALEALEILNRPPVELSPGEYRAFLAPAALGELLGLLGWGGFGLKSHRTKQTSLLRLAAGDETLSPIIELREHPANGIGPTFDQHGFNKPDEVVLVRGGRQADCLVSPRSAKEYGVPTNGASADESPRALELAPGDLPNDTIAAALERGIYVGNLWYSNYSDQQSCRITGMTRFGTFWVEGGQLVAPLAPMRFDDTIYRMLGSNLIGLTRERELQLDTDTYGQRSTASSLLPGALLSALRLTL
jgi:predicted Zn-dependent protease